MSARTVVIILMFILAIMVWLIVLDEPGEEPESSFMNDMAEVNGESPGHPGDDEDHKRASSADAGEAGESDESEESGAQSALFMGGEELDLKTVEDVAAKYAELKAAFEAGDVHAAYQLYELSFGCSVSPRMIETRRSWLEDETDPNQRESIRRDKRHFEAFNQQCEETEWGQPRMAYEEASQWHWKAAEAGHADAMYRTVFSGMHRSPREGARLSEDEQMDIRRDYLESLRDACHADALHSMGVHLSRDSAVTADFELQDHWDRDDDSARQMEGFAHRYAAARLREEGRPAEEARIPDQLLTAAEETQAARWAEDMLADCP